MKIDAPVVIRNGAFVALLPDGTEVSRVDFDEAVTPSGQTKGRLFTHTETDPDYREMGYGRHVVRAALTQSQDDGYHVLADCPFVVREGMLDPDLIRNPFDFLMNIVASEEITARYRDRNRDEYKYLN